jgi:hypothetical protein
MPSVKQQLEKMPHVFAVDDERGIDNGIIVTLSDNWCYRVDPGCGVRGFDNWSDALYYSRKSRVYRDASKNS